MPRWLIVPAVACLAAAAILVWPASTPNVLAVPPPTGDAEEPETGSGPAPDISVADALARVQVDPGLKVFVWAAEPLLANPVAFTFDEHGNAFVAETTRIKTGVPDTRKHMAWLDEDLAARTVADRLAMFEKHGYEGFEKYDDQVRKLRDTNGDGTADRSSVFSNGYNLPADGIAAGLLARQGTVYLTNVPSLYALKDADGDHAADGKPVLSTGYGIRAQFIGHDLHGLVMGPDGKLYFSIGDRGLNVVTKEGTTLSNTDSGCVLRCDPTGANLEIVHVGLRNPQELAFDDFGNLFTYDNNSDSGDEARWVQVVEGGDSGWRAGYQYGTYMHHKGVPQGNRGPWNTEKIWHVPGEPGASATGGTPAYIVPPLVHFGNGPAGLAHYPGVGLGERYKDHFFACDFKAAAGNSKIWSLAVKPKGASFEVTDLHPFVQQTVPTDCEFGPDGAFYWSDWVAGWNPPNAGRIFKLTDSEAMKNPAVVEAKTLIAEGMSKRGINELAELLGHPHQKVRFEAQYELAERAFHLKQAGEAQAVLVRVAKSGTPLVARLHAVWGLGMVGRNGVPDATAAVVALAEDTEVEVRAQVARVLASLPIPTDEPKEKGRFVQSQWLSMYEALTRLINDPEPRVRALVAPAFGRIMVHFNEGSLESNPGSERTVYTPLFDLLRKNADGDAYIRQAAVQGLVAATQNPADLFRYWDANKSRLDEPAVRLGMTLALRRLKGKDIAVFLADEDPVIVTEAARGVYDENIAAALPALAALADKPKLADPIAYRALAANYRLGTPENAARVAGFVARESEADHLREFGLKLLTDWPTPPRRDPITGLVHDLPARDAGAVLAAIRPVLPKLFAGSDEVRSQAVKMAKSLNATDVGPLMVGLVQDAGRPAAVRAEALFALDALKAKQLADAASFALTSDVPLLRAAARSVNAHRDEAAAVKELPALLDDPAVTVIEKQMALDALGSLKESEAADTALAAWLDRYLAGQVPPELKLDLLEAAMTRTKTRKLKLHAPLKEKLTKIEKAAVAAESADPLARYRESLAGGDAESGRSVFLNKSEVSCQRCHKLAGQGGDVGPPLDAVAKDKSREYLLEAIVAPNKAIAQGYDSVLIYTLDGKVVSGVLREKTAEKYTLVTGEGKTIVVPADDVESAKPDKSAMPDDLAPKLTRRELRDLVAFLAGMQGPPVQ